MNVDIKIEADKIAHEVINGSVEQAFEEFNDLIGNFKFLTSIVDKSLLNNLGTSLSKLVRKNPEGFLEFCEMCWNKGEEECRVPLGTILGALEKFIPDQVIEKTIDLCRTSKDIGDVDNIVTGFEPIIVRNPEEYFPLLKKFISEDNIWVKRLIIITVGHIMYRHKTPEITNQCLELIRPELKNEHDNIRKVTSWIIGSYGVRADQKTVADYICSFEKTDNANIVWTFSDAIRKTKISLQEDVNKCLIKVFKIWSNSDNVDVQKSAKTALKALGSF